MTKDNHLLGKFDLTGIPEAPRGVPQLEVTFEIDANGILTVGAVDKGTGKSEKITIKNDKGRLSEEDIERMVKEAEDFAEQDKKVKGKIDARNALETSVYNMKSSVEDKLKDKISAEDAKKVKAAITDINEWLDENSDAEQEEYEEKLKELEDVANPVISAAYAASGGAGGEEGEGADEDLGDHDEL